MADGGPGAISRVERLTDLVAFLLHAGHPRPLAEIVREVPGYPGDQESARVQFERDKKVLHEEGIEVRRTGEGAAAAYLIDPDEYYLPDLGLTEDEAVALNVALSAVQIDGTDTTAAGWKLGAATVGAGAGMAPVVTLTSLPQLPVLQDAMTRRATVAFRYGGSDRTVEPRGLLTRDGYWYLVAFDRSRDASRNFRVDRIEGAVTVGEANAFEVPPDFDLRTALPHEPWELGPGEPVEAVVRVARSHASRVEAAVGRQASVEHHDDGSVTIRLAVTNIAGFRSWLFGFLDAAQVVGPPELVADLVSHLRAMVTEGPT